MGRAETVQELQTGNALRRHRAAGRKPVSSRAKTPEEGRIDLADEVFCISEMCTHKLRKIKPQRKCEIGGMPSHVVKVTPYGEKREYWADVVTGSLYSTKTLRCLTSSRLKIRWAK